MGGDIINKLEEGKVIPMTYDYVFKSVLSENKEYLARILSNILNIDKDYILDNLVYKNTEHTKLSKKDILQLQFAIQLTHLFKQIPINSIRIHSIKIV